MKPNSTATPILSPLPLALQAPSAAASADLSQAELADAHWLLVSLLVEPTDHAWAWALPIRQNNPGRRLPMEIIVGTLATPCCDMLDDMADQAMAFGRATGASWTLVNDHRRGVTLRDLPGHSSARALIGSIELKMSPASDSQEHPAGLLGWLDQGLRDAFPHVGAMQGPFSAKGLSFNAGCSFGQVAKPQNFALSVSDEIIASLVGQARADTEARALQADTPPSKPAWIEPIKPRL